MNIVTAWLLYIVICFYCVVDAYQTKLLLEMGLYELNPWLSWLMSWSDTWVYMFLVKIGMLVFLGILLIKNTINRK